MKDGENTSRFRPGMLTYEDDPYPMQPEDVSWDEFWQAWIGYVELLKTRKPKSNEVTLTKEQIKMLREHLKNANRRQTPANIADIEGLYSVTENINPEWFRGRRMVIDQTLTKRNPVPKTVERIIEWMEEKSQENGLHSRVFGTFVADYHVDDMMLCLRLKDKGKKTAS